MGKMTYNEKATTFPNIIKWIDKIVETHKTVRGIIHTYSYEK